VSTGGSASGTRSRVVAAASIGLAVAVGVTGCGAAKQLSAKQQVSTALAGFNHASSAAFTVSLDTTAADLAAISKAQGEPMSASDRKAIAKVLDGDVVFDIQAPDGKTLGDSGKASTGTPDLTSMLNDPEALGAYLKKQGAFSLLVERSGDPLFELRSTGGVIYARAFVKRILKLAGQDATQLDEQLSGLPPALAPLAKAAKGQWVSLDLVKAAQAAKDQGLLDGLPKLSPSPSGADPAKVQKLIADLKTAYQQKATITVLPDSDKGTGYRLGAPAKQVAQAISADLISLVGKGSATEVKKAISQIPDRTFSLDLWVKDDNLTAVSLDLTQFLKHPVAGKKLAVNVAIKVNGGQVETPENATEINVKSLLSDLPAGLGLSGSIPGGPDLSSGSGFVSPGGKLTKAQIKQLKRAGLTDRQIQDMQDQQSQSGT
jgi:hypothetical protein